MIRTPRIFPHQISQLNRITQRIQLILPLPYPRQHIRLIMLPAVAVSLLIKSIRIRIQIHIKELLPNKPHQHVRNLLILSRRHEIRPDLRHTVPQPHSRYIPGNNISSPVLKPLHRSIQSIGKTVYKQLHHPGILRESLLHLLNQLLQRFRQFFLHLPPPPFKSCFLFFLPQT